MRLPFHRSRRHTKLRLEQLEDRTLLAVNFLGVPAWRNIGPGPIEDAANTVSLPSNAVGAIESVVVAHVPVSATNPGGYVLYAGAVNGGVWRADNLTDDMVTCSFTSDLSIAPIQSPDQLVWRPLTDAQGSLSVSSLALDPLDPSGNTLWVGTGSLSSGANLGGPAVGLLKTTDGGKTWTNVGSDYLAGKPILAVVPTLGISNGHLVNEVLVASYDKTGGVLYSLDGGQSFDLGYVVAPDGTVQGPLQGSATDLVSDPNNPGRYFTSVVGQGVFRTDDGGVTWTAIDGGTPEMLNAAGIKLAVRNNAGTTTLYVATVDNSGVLSGLFAGQIAANGQATWRRTANVPDGFQADVNQGGLAVVADPVESSTVYVSGRPTEGNFGSIYRVDVAHDSWTPLYGSDAFHGAPTGWAPHPDSRHLVFLNNSTLLESNDGGIYALHHAQSPDIFDRWVSLNSTLKVTEFFSIAYDETTGQIAGGTQDNGTPFFNGSRWSPLPVGGGDGGQAVISSSGRYYYFDDAILYRDSTRVNYASASSSDLGSGLTATDKKKWVTDAGGVDNSYYLAVNTSNPDQLLFAMNDLYETTTGGDTVVDITPKGWTGGTQYAAYAGSDNPAAAYASTTSGQLWVRATAGGTLSLMKSPPWTGGSVAIQIVVDPDNYKHAFVLDSNGRIWQTTDAGASVAGWTELTDNLNELPGESQTGRKVLNIEVYDPTPTGQPGDSILLAATVNGVYRRFAADPGGYSWHKFGTGMPNAPILALHYAPPSATNSRFGDVLLVGSFGRGAWIVRDAGSELSTPGTLQIIGDDAGVTNDTITLRLDPARTDYIQVVVNNKTQYDGPYSYFNQITLDGGGGQDVIAIEDIPAGVSVSTIESGNRNSEVHVGKNGSVQTILGSLTVTNPTNASKLFVDDSSDPTARTSVVLANGRLSGLSPGTISWSPAQLWGLDIRGGSGGNTFDVRGASASFPTRLFTGAGSDTAKLTSLTGNVTVDGQEGGDTYLVNFASVYSPVANLSGSVTVIDSGATGSDRVQVNDQGVFAGLGNFYQISDTAVTRTSNQLNYLNQASLTCGGIEALDVNAGDGLDSLAVKSLQTGVGLTINGGKGTNQFDVSPSGNLELIGGDLVLHGGTGTNLVTLYDAANRDIFAQSVPYVISASEVIHPVRLFTPGRIDFTEIDKLTLKVSPTDPQVNVDSTNARTTTVIDVGSAPTNILIGSRSTVQTVRGPVQIVGSQGLVNLVVDDSKDTVGRSSVTLSQNQITGLAPAVLGFPSNGLATLLIQGGRGDDTIDIESTPYVPGALIPVAVSAGPGNDRFMVAAVSRNLDAITSQLNLDGGTGSDSVRVSDRAVTGSAVYNLDGGNILRNRRVTSKSYTARIGYSDVSDLSVETADGRCLVTVSGTSARTSVNTGGGADDFSVGDANNSLGSILAPLSLNGGDGNNKLTLNDQGTTLAETYLITSSFTNRSGTANVDWAKVALVAVNGGRGGNTFNVQSASSTTKLTINTGSGQNVVNAGDPGSLVRDIRAFNIHEQGSTVLYVDDRANADQVNHFLTYDEITTTRPTYLLTDQSVVRNDVVRTVTQPISGGSAVVRSTTYVSNIGFDRLAGLQVLAGTSPNVVNLQATPANAPVTIVAGDAGDTVNVGSPNNLLRAIAAVSIDGGTGTVLNVNDQANADYLMLSPFSQDLDVVQIATRPIYTLTDQALVRRDKQIATSVSTGLLVGTLPVTSTIRYSHVAQIVVNAGQTINAFHVLGTAAGTTTTLNTGASSDTVDVGDTTHPLEGLSGPLIVNGNGSTTTLTLNDQASTGPRRYRLSSGQITAQDSGLGGNDTLATVSYAQVPSVTLNGATVPGPNEFDLLANGPGVALALNGGASTDVFKLGSPGHKLDDITGVVAIHANQGADEMTLDDTGDAADTDWSITAIDVTRSGLPPIAYDGIENLTANAGSGADHIRVASTAAATAVRVNAGAGADRIDVGDDANTLDGILGNVTLDGQDDMDVTRINDQGIASPQTYTLTNSGVSVARAGVAPITIVQPPIYSYDGLEVHAGDGGNTFQVNGTLGDVYYTTLYSGSGDDQVNVLATSLNSYLMTSLGGGLNQVRIGSIGAGPSDTSPHEGQVQNVLGFVYPYAAGGVGIVVDDANSLAQHSNIQMFTTEMWNVAPGIIHWDASARSLDVYLGTPSAGGHTIVTKGLPAFTPTTFNLGDGTNSVTLGIGDNIRVYNLTVQGGQGVDSLTFDGTSGTANRNYIVDSSHIARDGYPISIQYSGVENVRVLAGGGHDTIQVGLTSPAPAVTIDGGPGNDLLVSTGLTASLLGGGGNDLLIAGPAAGMLDGGAGEDLLVAGATDYDAQPNKLRLVLSEWSRADLDYDARTYNITNGLGLTAGTALNAATVHSNGQANAVTGGIDRDLFFMNLANDTSDIDPLLETLVEI